MFPAGLPPVEDIIRNVHFATLGASALLVVSADLTASKSVVRNLGQNDFSRLHRYHTALTWGLLFFWISGIYLIWDVTGLDAAEFSPKLIAKLLTVSILTLNAIVIGRILLPFMEENPTKRFGDHDLSDRLCFAVSGAISSASWVSAFCLGYFTHLKTASVSQLFDFMWPVYAGVTGAAVVFALVSGRPQPKARPDPIESST